MTGTTARSRRAGLLVLAATLLALLLVAVLGGGLADRRAGAPTPSTSSPSDPVDPTDPDPGLPVGLNTARDLLHLDPAALDRALDQIVATGITWIRLDLSWTDLQPVASHRWQWSDTDRVVAAARDHDLEVLGLLTYTPAWARASGCAVFTCPPTDPAAFARYSRTVADRYVPRGVTTYQIWNEPNLDRFWTEPDAVAYGQLLRRTLTALRAGHDDLTLLLGSLAHVGSTEGNIAPDLFLRLACARGCPVDAVGYDPYTFPDLPETRGEGAWSELTAKGSVRRAVDRTVGRHVPIWVTQFGAPVLTPGISDDRLVDEARQSTIVLAGLRLARRDERIGGFFVNGWRDVAGSTDYRDHFGLWRADGTPRPAVAALRAALR